MPCEYCDRDRSTRYSVAASVGDTDATVPFEFCCRECLAAWSIGDGDVDDVAIEGARVA